MKNLVQVFVIATLVFGVSFYLTKPKTESVRDEDDYYSNYPKVSQIVYGGESIDVQSYIVPGAVTIVDFYADWCAPCRAMAPRLKAFVGETEGVYLRKVDIESWKTPIVRKYGIRSIPSVWVYGRDDRLVAKKLNRMSSIKSAVKKAL